MLSEENGKAFAEKIAKKAKELGVKLSCRRGNDSIFGSSKTMKDIKQIVKEPIFLKEIGCIEFIRAVSRIKNFLMTGLTTELIICSLKNGLQVK